MSDAIREALEALVRVSNYASVPFEMMTQFSDDVDAIKAALQSQTAPAVPEGWKLVPIEPTEEMRKRAGLSRGADFYTISKVWDAMLAAAPQPDHSPDAGKVVQGKNRYGLDMGYFDRLIAREFNDLSNFRPDEFARVCARMAATADASVLQEKEFHAVPVADDEEVEPVGWLVEREGDNTFPHFYFNKNQAESMVSEVELLPFATMRPVYTHPAQPRNEDAEAREEIKADAERYRWLKAQYHREYCPLTIAQRVAGGLFEWAVEDPSSAIDAARLRSNGGDD